MPKRNPIIMVNDAEYKVCSKCEKLLKIHAWHEKCKADFEREVNKSYE